MFTEHEQCSDLSRLRSVDDLRKFRARFRIQTEDQSRSGCVWIAVFAQQDVVALAVARHDIDVTSAEQVRDLAYKPKFFIGHPAGGDDRDVCAAELSELERRVRDRTLPIARDEFFSIGNLRLEPPILRFEIF